MYNMYNTAYNNICTLTGLLPFWACCYEDQWWNSCQWAQTCP